MDEVFRPSAYLQEWAHHLDCGTIIDVPSGAGRNAGWIAAQGKNVVCVDIDREAIHRALFVGSVHQAWISGVVADANRSLPFEAEAFQSALIIHPMDLRILENVSPLLRRHGVMIFETYDARGENWRGLPSPMAIRTSLQSRFGFFDYRERSVGPRNEQVVVKLCAYKL
jgi:2-polyprenyl-3-methyl-5-hydroxy-6-metoxy-1,4-benzoquinol methylase